MSTLACVAPSLTRWETTCCPTDSQSDANFRPERWTMLWKTCSTFLQCHDAIMDFKLQYMLQHNGNAVCDYMNIATPSTTTGTADCNSVLRRTTSAVLWTTPQPHVARFLERRHWQLLYSGSHRVG